MGGIYDVSFGKDDFQNPKTLGIVDSIAQQLINLFLMEPGSLPSMPHIGIGIRRYMTYTIEGSFDENELKTKIYSQAKEILPYLDLSEISIVSFEYEGSGMIYMTVPVSVSDSTLLVGFKQNELNSSIIYDYKVESNKFI